MPEKDNIPLTHLGEIIANEPDRAHSMAVIDFYMEALKDPEDALSKADAPDYIFTAYAEKRMRAFAQVIAEETGADPEQIINPKTRTEEQQKLLVELSGRSMMKRFQAYWKSNFASAKILLMDTAKEAGEGIYMPIYDTNATPEEMQSVLDVPHLAALYFFALHPEVDPQEQNAFENDEYKKELFGIFARMDAFYRENRDYLQTEPDFAAAFIEHESPADAEKTQEITERLTALAVVPKFHVAPTHKLVNSLTQQTRDLDPKQDIISIVVDVAKRGAKKSVLTTCLLSYEGENLKITGRKQFLEYDRAVYNAVVSLYLAGNTIITCNMIWRTMNGKTEQEQATPAQQAEVEESLEKLRFMRAQIDCSAEFEMRHISLEGDRINGGGYDDTLLHLKVRWLKTAKGQSYRAYEILATPILYEYSAAAGKQLQTQDIKTLDVKKLDRKGKPTTHSLEYTTQRVVIKSYLLRRIKGMKGDNNLDSKCIALRDYRKDGTAHDGLYTIAGHPELSQPAPDNMTEAEKTKRKNTARYIREDAELMLKYWKTTGYIKGYTIYKDKGINAGFEIAL